MSLRTYPLIAHPAFLRFIELQSGNHRDLENLDPNDVPPHLPALSRIYDIASYLDVTPEIIRSIQRYKWKHYRTFFVTKRSGSKRIISAPRTFLKVIQWWILDTILVNCEASPYAFGFVRGRSFIQNANSHLGSRHIINLDIENFFPSISGEFVTSVFSKMGYSDEVAAGLTDLVTVSGGLPQGAPTSPMLANLIFVDLDIELNGLAKVYGAKYTRYADDLTFSSKDKIDSSIVSDVQALLNVYGLRINSKKTRFMGPNQILEVTGIVLGRDGLALRREYLNGARGWFYSIIQNPTLYVGASERVRGTLGLITQVGGRGAPKVIELGRRALAAVSSANVIPFPELN